MVKLDKPAGYNVSTATSFVGKSPSPQEKAPEYLMLTIDTPYEYDGVPLGGYANVSMNADPNKRFVSAELWHNGRNVEDVVGISDGRRDINDVVVRDAVNDKYLPLSEAYDRVRSFALDASRFEHVMVYDEYVTLHNNTHKGTKAKFADMGEEWPEANEQSYGKYLDKCKSMMNDREYIGEIATPEQVDSMYQTTPSFKESYDEWSKTTQRELPEVAEPGTEGELAYVRDV